MPRGVRGKQPPLCLPHRHVQKENPIRYYYSNQNVAPCHIQKLVASVEKPEESCSRKIKKTHPHKLAIRLPQHHYKKLS